MSAHPKVSRPSQMEIYFIFKSKHFIFCKDPLRLEDTFQLILRAMRYLFLIWTFYSVKMNNCADDGWMNPQGNLQRASDNTTCINHSGEQFMKEKLSVFWMTLEELNRSQFEEGTFSFIVHSCFSVSLLCCNIHFQN